LREAVVLTRLRQQLASIAAQLEEKAAEIATTPSVDILEGAQEALLSEASPDSRERRGVERVLLGEDWFDAAIPPASADPADRKVFVEACRVRHEADVDGLRRAL